MITKICLISALIGIILLILISDKIEIDSSVISSIKKEDINKHVKITGIVKKAVNNLLCFIGQ